MATTQGDVVIAFEEYFHLRVILNFCFIYLFFFKKNGISRIDGRSKRKLQTIDLQFDLFHLWCAQQNSPY